MKAGASNYLEFKYVEASYIWSGRQGLMLVPDSRASIFQDRTLSLVEKRHLMRFFKLVQNHDGAGELSSEVLVTPFVDFLDQQRLPSSIKSYSL
jgi:RAB protein geranylgeranyltransferase component A